MKSVDLKFAVLCAFLGYFLTVAHSSFTNDTTPEYLENLLNEKKFKKFAKILQIPNPDLVDSSQRKALLYEQTYYNGFLLTDILLRPGQILNDNKYFDLNGHLHLSVNKWENGIVPYYISKAFENNQTEFINKEIQYANNALAPNVKYRPYKDGDTDYVMFFRGGSGCYSNLGRVGGPQVISLTNPCLIQGLVTHELQHVLGIAHEPNRSDRDEYIDLQPQNIPQVLKSQYVKYSAHQFVNTGPFDYYSIMNLHIRVPGFNELYAFKVKQDDIDESKVGADKMFVPSDIERVKTLYPLKSMA